MTLLEGAREARHLSDDDPSIAAAIAANFRPAEIRAVSCLAEDTLFTQPVADTDVSPIQVEPFRNPFNGLEEVLYISADKELWHAARGTGAAEPTTPGAGWRVTKVSDNATSVQAVQHPNGCVYAFCTTQQSGAGQPGYLAIWELVSFDSASGVSTWGQIDDHLPEEVDAVSKVFVHHLDDRAATPVVFAVMDDPLTAEGQIIPIFGGWDNRVQPWEPRASHVLSEEFVGGLFAIGYDDSSLTWLRTYSVSDGSLWMCGWRATGESSQARFDDDTWVAGIGGFSGPSGFGAVGIGREGELRVSSLVAGDFFMEADISTLPLPSGYGHHRLWQDAAGLMHLYAIDQGNQLNVLHQMGWQEYVSGQKPSFPPLWDSMLKDGNPVGAMRPLVSQVDIYGVDSQPDSMPNQCVYKLYGGPEAMVVLTQQLGTSYWESEVVRVAQTLADDLVPHLAPRYKTQVTVVDSGGRRVPMCAVTVTADAPVDLEVAGTFYRLRPTAPVTLTTDMAGSLTLKVDAHGLATPNLHLSVQGVVQALTLQPAAEIHRFLAGEGQLPSQPSGLTAQALVDAKTPDGVPVFPLLAAQTAEAADSWHPSADEVLGWFKAAFSVSSGTALPSVLTSRLVEGEEVLGFSLQTHDRSRPALEVFTTAEQLAQHRARIGASDPDPAMQEWFGDVVEGVRSAAVQVSQVSVDLVNRTLTGLVDMAGTATKAVSGFWDDVVSAAHCVELMASALGAQIHAVVEWLTWPLNLADVWWTKGCMEGLLTDVMSEVRKCIEAVQACGTKWTDLADSAIDDAVSAAAEVFGSQYTGRFERPSMNPGSTAPGFGALFPSLPDWWPHLDWWQELVSRFSYNIPFDDTGNPLPDLITKLAALPQWAAFEQVLTDLGTDLSQLFDPTNANTWSQILITAFVNASADIAKAGVSLAGAAFDMLCEFGLACIDVATAWYASKIIDIPALAKVWDWVQGQAGVPLEDREALTVGRAAMFMWCYPGTAGYKVLFGQRPFGDVAPTVADLKKGARLAELSDRARADDGSQPGTIYPYAWGAHAVLQYFCVQQMTADAAFDWKINNEAICKAMGIPFISMSHHELVIWATLHQLAYGVGDMPYIWGNDMYNPAKTTPDKWGPGVMWAMSWVANSADVGCAAHWGAFVNSFEKSDVAGHTYSALAIGRIIISCLRYIYGEDNKGYSFAIWNCAINVTSFVSAIGWPRWMLNANLASKTWLAIVWTKARVDSMCDAFAGIASVEQILFESFFPPRIKQNAVTQTFQQGESVDLTWTGYLGVAPYSWSVEPPEVVPPGAQGGLPAWLEQTKGQDPDALALSGTADSVGTWVFDIVMTDDYGPSFGERLATSTITVTAT